MANKGKEKERENMKCFGRKADGMNRRK